MSTFLIVDDITIKQDAQGRYHLNDLHRASGGADKDQPSNWLRNDQTKALIEALKHSSDLRTEQIQPLMTHMGGNGPQGTFVCQELVYDYAM